MSVVKQAPVSQLEPLRKASDSATIPTRIASPLPRLATPPSPASSSSTVSEEDEADKPSVSHTPEPEIDATPPPIPRTQKIIDMDTFRQILDLDEPGDHDFSFSMVEEYFKQAEETFRKLDKSFKDKKLSELSTLGHFLKGSSAAIGLVKVQASCEKIQHYGAKRDEEVKMDLEPEDALDKIESQLEQLREEYAEAKQSLEDWFREHEED